jgi:hypothetical protein
MSDISLYSGLYETIRRWAELIDNTIVSLKESKLSDTPISLEELQNLFSKLAEDEDTKADFSDHQVAKIIESKLNNVNWRDLSNRLSDSSRRETILPILEDIAQGLAEKHADTVAKMRLGHQ